MPREFEWEDETLGSEDFYREDLEDLLQEGAWSEGFNEWTEYTSLGEEQIRLVDDLGLFQTFDFYWDPTQNRLRFDAPSMPDDEEGRDATESFGAETASTIDAELTELGRTVQEVLEDYLDRNDESSDYGWGEETYGNREE
jgi:hypothetical protein